MSESRPYWVQAAWVLAACALFAAAGLLQPLLDRMGQEYDLVPPGNVTVQRNPKTFLLTVAPGALRAPILGYLWIRAENLKNNGHYYDALQLAELICELQPHFAGGWTFMAWNMSYNISVGCHTEADRWRWVYNGIKLLRDRGIPYNPRALNLYRELGWIYFHKVAGFMDDMHTGYKRRWAALMQQLLAPPPCGTTAETIDAFRPIAEAPLDKDPRIQGRELIQSGKLAELLADPAVAEYAGLLAAQGVEVGDGLLEAYNRHSKDECIRAIRPMSAGAERQEIEPSRREAAVAELINSPKHARARSRLLAFVRAQILWNRYKLDPQWMLGMMERYGPLDWRLALPHAMYWATYGFHAVEGTPLESLDRVEALNNSRNILFGLKELTWRGRLTYEEDPNDPERPIIRHSPDPRFIESTQKEFVRLIARSSEDRSDVPEENVYRAGHINYLVAAIQLLYVYYRHDQARQFLDYLRDTYHLKGGVWDMELADFVVRKLIEDKTPGRTVALNQVVPSIVTAYLLRLENDDRAYRSMSRHARQVYTSYQENVPQRNWLPPLEELEADALAALLVNPRVMGYDLPLLSRVRLYGLMDDRLRRMRYRFIAPRLRSQCEAEGIDFTKAFPPPAGIE
ncbi:MAG TPA: hypothetical protein VM098_03410 [Phycisphaerae bacterium]|nr:hypothetical protein [Phycisphaerae bacterium]